MKRRREWSALLAGVMALGVLGGGISVSADEDVPTIVIYNNSGAFSVAGAEAPFTRKCRITFWSRPE